ncbi:MAG: aminotransferase class I/II-fold pyridoxal phosphate-dependent enzyme [Bacteroidota bacterium]
MDVLTYRELLKIRTQLDASSRTATFSRRIWDERAANVDGLQYRHVLTPTDREVTVRDYAGETRPMLMFGSNNYLGLATHPVVVKRVQDAIAEYGVGVGGPPALNGHGPLQRELQERLAALEGKEACLLYGTGYSANVGLMSALPSSKDYTVYDGSSHASFLDGMKLGKVKGQSFPHNDTKALDLTLSEIRGDYRDVFVSVEGVYSMTGDVARLDRVAEVATRHNTVLIVDDAHGTGVTGPNGHGTIAMYDVADQVDVIVGTFSKTFAVSGGFIAASREVVEYLRYFSRAHVFSASLSTSVCAAVLAGLDVMEDEPHLHQRLMDLSGRFAETLNGMGFEADGITPIFSLRAPVGANVRAMAHAFHDRGLFVNHVEAPVVPASEQRFRISLSATHTDEDVARLVEAIEEIWALYTPRGDGLAEPVDEPRIDAFEGGF